MSVLVEETMTGSVETSLKFIVTCLEGDHCTVHFEPEGAEVPLAPGGMLRVEITGENDDELEISYIPGGLIIGVWKNAKTRVWDRAGQRVSV
jgi:hypothetical protein